MNTRLICPKCESDLCLKCEDNKLRNACVYCAKCDYSSTLSAFRNEYLVSLSPYPDFKIHAGELKSCRLDYGYIRLPEFVTVIKGGYDASWSHIKGCFEAKNIEGLDTSENLRVIGDYAFARCESLCEVNLNEGLVLIKGGAFFKCSSLKEIVIPSTCYEIWWGAFQQCTSIKKVVFLCDENHELQRVPNIWGGAFRGCTNLENIRLPYGLKTISSEMFYECLSLKSISIPETVNKIESNAFNNCTSITKIELKNPKNGNLEIENGAFFGMTGLRSVILPNNTKIGHNVFRGCSNLSDIQTDNLELKREIERDIALESDYF